LEKEAHNKDLQRSHGHHHEPLDHTEVEDAALRAPDCAEIAVLARAEVFLVTGDSRKLGRELVDRFL
jgi:hypothetical protein